MAENTVGVAYFRVDGVQYSITGEMRINPLTEKRTPLVGMDGSIAMQTEFQSPMIECSVRDRKSVDLLALTRIDSATITVQMGNGTMWELTEAAFTGDGEFDGKEGALEVRFNGRTMRRIA